MTAYTQPLWPWLIDGVSVLTGLIARHLQDLWADETSTSLIQSCCFFLFLKQRVLWNGGFRGFSQVDIRVQLCLKRLQNWLNQQKCAKFASHSWICILECPLQPSHHFLRAEKPWETRKVHIKPLKIVTEKSKLSQKCTEVACSPLTSVC